MRSRSAHEGLRGNKEIMNQLAIVIRTGLIHNSDNIAVITAIEKLVSLINPLVNIRPLTLELFGEYFYAEEGRIRYSMEHILNFNFLVREFRNRELGSITIKEPLTNHDVQRFLKAFLDATFSKKPFDLISKLIEDVPSLFVGPLKKIRDDDLDVRRLVKKTYFNAVSYTKQITGQVQQGEKISVKKSKRIIELIVDMILHEEQLLLGMTAVKDFDEYTYHHSVNVSILSVALGQRLGLSRGVLTEIGLAALFHDIGKMQIPTDILNKPAGFDEGEWQVVKKHPTWGVQAILRLKELDTKSIMAAIVAFQHHHNFDSSGYPKVLKPLELDLYSKIVTIADKYDALTSCRVYSKVAMAPDKALSLLMEEAGTKIDPILFKFFVNMIGVFPVGTLVLLDTKELGLVQGSNTVLPERPRVLIILDGKGRRVDSHVVDLTEKSDISGQYLRTITKTMDPNKYNINLAEYLL